VAVLDPQQLEELQCLIMTGELIMMKKDSVLNVLSKYLLVKGVGRKISRGRGTVTQDREHQ